MDGVAATPDALGITTPLRHQRLKLTGQTSCSSQVATGELPERWLPKAIGSSLLTIFRSRMDGGSVSA
jgi:hypothetical protein